MPRASRSQTSTAAGPRLVGRRTATPPVSVSHDDIAQRAYELFLGAGCPHGHDVEHWLEAERQLVQARTLAGSARRATGKRES